MPELIEVELYRQALDATVGRRISAVLTPDPTYARNNLSGDEVRAALVGTTIESTTRIGKLAVAALDSGHQLGLRFGMTGRLVVDDVAVIDELELALDVPASGPSKRPSAPTLIPPQPTAVTMAPLTAPRRRR